MFSNMFQRWQRTAAIALLMVGSGFLANCQTAPAPSALPEISFTRYQPIYMDVGSIDIIEEYKSPMRKPYVEQFLPLSPTDAMRAWVRDRLKAQGSSKSLQVIIKDASVVSSNKQEFDQLFGPAPNRRYDARLEVELRVYGADAMSEADVKVVSTQTITLSDSASLEDRKRVFYRMIFDLMEGANAELEKQIFTYFQKYIMYGQTP